MILLTVCRSVKRKSGTASLKGTANGANKRLVLHVRIRCGSMSTTTPVSLLANEFDVRSELHVQVNLEAVSHFLCFCYNIITCYCLSYSRDQYIKQNIVFKADEMLHQSIVADTWRGVLKQLVHQNI